eukprot:TRINITY_DN484_c0_g1_i1.p1 TRINITY_DN484_c0_g1~~TRINITY_DN484_c0_g1_i1.p1  ORF type:complete len:209 (+),score=82.24 TRINITY_DN484_c0_g1_i1:37-627(+)
MSLAALKTVQKLSTKYPTSFKALSETQVPRSWDSAISAFRDEPQFYNALLPLGASLEKLNEFSSVTKTAEIDFDFYRKHYSRPEAITKFEQEYKSANLKERVPKPNFDAAIEEVMAVMENTLKELNSIATQATKQSESIQAKITEISQTAKNFENLTIEEVARLNPTVAKEVEDELLAGKWGIEKEVEEPHGHGHH